MKEKLIIYVVHYPALCCTLAQSESWERDFTAVCIDRWKNKKHCIVFYHSK
jgi:hypothetical protein